jgi:hypothetical protein
VETLWPNLLSVTTRLPSGHRRPPTAPGEVGALPYPGAPGPVQSSRLHPLVVGRSRYPLSRGSCYKYVTRDRPLDVAVYPASPRKLVDCDLPRHLGVTLLKRKYDATAYHSCNGSSPYAGHIDRHERLLDPVRGAHPAAVSIRKPITNHAIIVRRAYLPFVPSHMGPPALVGCASRYRARNEPTIGTTNSMGQTCM